MKIAFKIRMKAKRILNDYYKTNSNFLAVMNYPHMVNVKKSKKKYVIQLKGKSAKKLPKRFVN